MTGERTDEEVFELADDPLMASGEKWFIFARQNDNGTYTILTGPCGRFAYDLSLIHIYAAFKLPDIAL